MARKAYRTIEGIPGIARAGEYIVIDQNNPGILVGRWVHWDELSHIMLHESSLYPDPGFRESDQPKRAVRRRYPRLIS